MRKEEIAELIRLVEESGIAELEVCRGRNRIRISRNGTAHAAYATPFPQPTSGVPASQPDDESDLIPPPELKLASNLKQIVSPMVGTFYRSPAPGSDSFVEIGQPVAVGQTVCIVEAMKLMNEIGSDFTGVVRKVLIENAQPVEYGQPLFLVEIK